ncbi:hypothetical protein [Microbacterium sp.]|uniref:hypothetical protein n=1 Tax=Microbacterium sp. TaxID=51671 RepID=UPI002E35DD8A|nr:hypothetical protein [Microbacterium sp.]HEX5730993.1 hypothetical protein [Microbacterium sp.]
MRKYLFGTGLVTAIMGGITLLRGLRSEERFTWRIALAWISWGISLALAIGTIVDTRRASVGKLIDSDSPVAGKSEKLLKKRLRRTR